MKLIITQKQNDEMLEAAKPLIKWFRSFEHSHFRVIVTSNTVELVDTVAFNIDES